jgi:predicted metal-dependent peptidase
MISARSSLMMGNCFFGTLAMKMKWVEDPTAHKMWTDMVNMGYNPEWAKTASHDELMARIAEITMHNSNGHSWRRSGRDQKDWNIACDRALWNFLNNAGFALPDDVHYDPSDLGQSAEKIYAKIHKPKQPSGEQPPPPPVCPGGEPGEQPPGDQDPQDGDGDGGGNDPGSAGEVRDAPTKEQEDQLRTDWQIATVQAAQQAKSRGQLPGGLEDLLESITHPAVDWKAALRKFMQQAAKNDFSWRRPNRRYVAQGIYLPEIHSESMPPVLIGIDTSSSISKEELDAFATELTAIMRECQPEKTHVAYCNTDVHKTEEFDPDEDIKFGRLARGGTDMRAIVTWAEEQDIEFAACIIFTDMETPFPESAPSFPLMWATKARGIEAPCGETLFIHDL